MKTYILEERVGTKTSTRKANSVKQICTMLKSTLRFHGSKAIVTAYEAPATPQEEQELDLIAARTDQKSIKGIANGVYGTKARAALNPEKEEK